MEAWVEGICSVWRVKRFRTWWSCLAVFCLDAVCSDGCFVIDLWFWWAAVRFCVVCFKRFLALGVMIVGVCISWVVQVRLILGGEFVSGCLLF